jgi:hypothetical protein
VAAVSFRPPPPQLPSYGPSGVIRPIGAVDPLARLSLALGLLGICCGVTGPFAILLGVLANNRIDVGGGTVHGRGMALAGIVLGSLETAIVIAGAVGSAIAAVKGGLPR